MWGNRAMAKRAMNKKQSLPQKDNQQKNEPLFAMEDGWAVKLIGTSPDLVCICTDGSIAFINEAGTAMLGLKSAKRLMGRPFADFIHADYLGIAGGLLDGRDGSADSDLFPLKLKRSRGKTIDVEILAIPYGEPDDKTVIIRARDITDRVKTFEDLLVIHSELEDRVDQRTEELTREIRVRRKAEQELLLAGKIIENFNEGVMIFDRDMKVFSINPAFTEITGYRAKDIIGKKPHFQKVLEENEELSGEIWQALDKKDRWQGEFWNKRKNGDEYAERLSISAIADESGNVQEYAVVISDVTKRKQDEEHIRFQANYDALTGLPNRTLFMDRLAQSLPAMRRSETNLGLMFIDLDGFKLVNDTLGHNVGDQLLMEAAGRLQKCIRDGDTVARLGGDEFTIIMPNLADPRDAPLVAQRVLDALSKPFQLQGHESFISGSIGITVFPDDATDPNELIKNADAAMYRAKEQGKANYNFYTADLNEQVKERMVLKNGLSKALENGEFSLFYQPKLKTMTEEVTGVEALMRWNSPELGMVSPVRFIPILEETGLLVEVGEWALRTACMQHKAWLDEGLPPISVAVNLSARQLREDDFVPLFDKVLNEAGIGPEGLEVEITESMLMSDATRAVEALEEISAMGIQVSMDDFGTGYSSLSYIKRFPIDTIKIDRSFVSDIATNPDDAEIIKTIINMGQTLNRKIVAEGVETEEQLTILREYRCDEIQGYYFSPPLPAEEATAFLKQSFKDVA